MELQTKKGRWFTNIGLSLMAILWLFPIFVMFKESLRVNGFENYIATLQNPNFPQFVINSFIVYNTIVSLIESLQKPGIYDHPVTGFELLETHISWVLLTG